MPIETQCHEKKRVRRDLPESERRARIEDGGLEKNEDGRSKIEDRQDISPSILDPQSSILDLQSSILDPRFSIPSRPSSRPYLAVKSMLEFVGATFLLALTSPLILLAVVLVRATSRGPGIYSQVRLGRLGKPYRIYKIRTMVHECEKQSGVRWSSEQDPRITPLGRLLRRTHIDELPQLWNVIRGDMSLIGPRPERPEIVPTLQRAIPHYTDRLWVRPGVTGLAQVQLPADTDLESVRRKLAYDLYYVRQVNFWLDLRILCCTAFKVGGVPFHVLRGLFHMPTRIQVERAYRKLGGVAETGAAEVLAQIQMA
jgi:lipopolysaccharide/colanic/teichoic acid biosynthesis glycosyltransferase